MRLRHIEVFHAVYTCGSITAAAKLLNVSQPSVSKVLAHAEQQLGYLLFDRVKGKIVPTLEAERLIGQVSSVFKSIDELQRVSQNIAASDVGRIRIATTPAFGIDLVPAAIADYLGDHPDTDFELETLHFHQVARAINQSRIDMGVVFSPSPVPGITAELIASAELVAVTPKDFGPAEKQVIQLQELQSQPFIQLSSRSPLGELLTERMQAAGVEFRTNVRVETYQMAMSLVAHGAGVAIVDEITARSSAQENVRIWRLDPAEHFDVAVLRLEGLPLSVVAQRFVSHLKTHVREFFARPIAV